MRHEPAIATRAWLIAEKHIPHFAGLYTPARNGILSAVTEALKTPIPQPLPEERERWKLEECTHEIRCTLSGINVRIWSGEHGAYWRAESSGYTSDSLSAGVYEFDEAWRRTRHCGPEKRIAFEPIIQTKGGR